MSNRIVHFEIMADEPEKAAAFYEKVFGWKIQKWEGSAVEYWMVTTGDKGEPGIDGGILRTPEGLSQKSINTVVVDDIDVSIAKIVEAGGSVCKPKYAIPGVGEMAYCADAEGAVFGLHKGEQK